MEINTHIERTFIASNDRTVARTDFASKHMPLIIEGSRMELDGWCNAYNEAIRLIESGKIDSFRQYAELSANSQYSMNTIKTYVSYVSWAVNDSGISMDEWDSIEEIKNTRYPKADKAKASKGKQTTTVDQDVVKRLPSFSTKALLALQAELSKELAKRVK